MFLPFRTLIQHPATARRHAAVELQQQQPPVNRGWITNSLRPPLGRWNRHNQYYPPEPLPRCLLCWPALTSTRVEAGWPPQTGPRCKASLSNSRSDHGLNHGYQQNSTCQGHLHGHSGSIHSVLGDSPAIITPFRSGSGLTRQWNFNPGPLMAITGLRRASLRC